MPSSSPKSQLPTTTAAANISPSTWSSSSSSPSPYLSAPTASTSRLSKQTTLKSEKRLFVGNLHPSVDEYALVQTFNKHGRIVKLDFLFHKSGPLRGNPRGYAFVEYSSREEATKALVETNNRLLRGKKLAVTFATQNTDTSGAIGPHRRKDAETNKPTTLSLIKNASRPEGTDAKIAAMEAKLAMLRAKSSQR